MDGAVAGVWTLTAWAQGQGGRPLDWGLAIQCGLIAWLFLRRQPASRSAGVADQLLAGAMTIMPMLLLRPTSGGWDVPGSAIEAAAILWLLWSLAALGTSFGMAPALRGIVARGPYRWVRHPLYSGSLVYVSGYLMRHPSTGNALVLLFLTIGQVIRAQREERLLEQVAEYRAYMRLVRGRFIPHLAWPSRRHSREFEEA